MKVTNEERDLVFEIAGGNPNILQFIGHMRVISLDAHGIDYLYILRYMKREKLCGHNFSQWFIEKHDKSMLNAISDLRRKAHSDFKKRKIFAKRVI